MSIQTAFSNISSNVSNDLTSIFTQTKAKLSGIIGNVTTSMSNVWDGGFAGIDVENFDTIMDAFRAYCDAIEENIDGFDQTTNLDDALKGEINKAANEYVDAIKELISAYVTTMRKNIDDAEKAKDLYTANDKSIHDNVMADAQEIRQQAEQIRLD